MVDPSEEKPLELLPSCSATFWEEDSSVLASSDLLHFTTNIKRRCAAITIDNGSLLNFVSIEVVEKLKLFTYQHNWPYMLDNNDETLPITHGTYVPLTISGHTVKIPCDVIPRAFNSCHLLLGNDFCEKFEVEFSKHPDIGLFWNNKKTWIIHESLKNFQEVRCDNLCSPIISKIRLSEHVDIKDKLWMLWTTWEWLMRHVRIFLLM